MPKPLESLIPTDDELDLVLVRFPILTATGLYPYEKYQREADRCAEDGLPLPARKTPIVIARADVRKDIALVRLFCSATGGKWIGGHMSYNLKHEVERWAGKPVWHGAVIAGLFLEGTPMLERVGNTAVEFVLRLRPEIHFRLKARANEALAVVNAGLDSVNSPDERSGV
jgi:hypothetical protein